MDLDIYDLGIKIRFAKNVLKQAKGKCCGKRLIDAMRILNNEKEKERKRAKRGRESIMPSDFIIL